MKRAAVLAVVIVILFGTGVVLAAESGVSRVLLAKGMHKGDVSIQAPGPVEITHQSFIVPAKTVFETVNTGSDTAEVHVTGFLPPGQRVKAEEKPGNC